MLIWKEPSGRSESARAFVIEMSTFNKNGDFKIILKFDSVNVGWKNAE